MLNWHNRFNGLYFLEKWRGKRIMFVGDSLSLNQFQSLTCMIHASVPKSKTTFIRKDGLSSVTFDVSFLVFCLCAHFLFFLFFWISTAIIVVIVHAISFPFSLNLLSKVKFSYDPKILFFQSNFGTKKKIWIKALSYMPIYMSSCTQISSFNFALNWSVRLEKLLFIHTQLHSLITWSMGQNLLLLFWLYI